MRHQQATGSRSCLELRWLPSLVLGKLKLEQKQTILNITYQVIHFMQSHHEITIPDLIQTTVIR